MGSSRGLLLARGERCAGGGNGAGDLGNGRAPPHRAKGGRRQVDMGWARELVFD